MLFDSVGKYQKTSANSVANLAYNLFGYLPAPGLYGILASATGGKKSRWGMGMLLYSTIFTVIFLIYGTKLKLEKEAKKFDESRRDSLANNKSKKYQKREKNDSSPLETDDLSNNLKMRLSGDFKD